MKTIRHLAVYLPDGDHTDPAVVHAVSLLKRLDARLTLLSATPIAWRNSNADRLKQLDEARLRGVAAALAGFDVEVRVLEGPPVEALRTAVGELEIDLLVKTARPKSMLDRLVGRVARDLLGSCPCPLLIVRNLPRVERAPVIAAVSALGWGAKPSEVAVSRRVIRLAAELAILEGRPLSVVHAWEPLNEHVLARTVTREALHDYIAEQERDIAAELRELVWSCKVSADIEVLRGADAATLVTDHASRRRSETIVMGASPRSAFRRLLTGCTTQQVIDIGRSNVLAVEAA